MTIVLTHPIHGAKIAICEKEALADIENGWSRLESAEESNKFEPIINVKRKHTRRNESLVSSTQSNKE